MQSKKILNGLEITALLCVMLSLLAILLYPYSFNKSLVLSPSQGYPKELGSDKYNQGHSKATWIDYKNSYKWQCVIREGYEFPYCLFKLNLADPDSGYGLNLSSYDKITINYLFEGDQEDTIRIHLRTHHEELTERHNTNSHKYNEIELKPSRDGSPITFLMSDFTVAHWWVLQRNLSIIASRVDFSEVMYLEVLTGTHATLGEKIFEIKDITFTGKQISKANFYLVIILFWLALIFLVISYRLILLRRAYKYAQSESAHLKDVANHDQLSKLLNRHAIDKLFHKLDYDWKHNHIGYSLIVVDIDHFKMINDNHGHAFGDKIIKLIAKILDTHTRSQDYVGRWGGEEFIILLPATQLDDAVKSAEKLRLLIELYSWSKKASVTASFGVSHVAKGLTPEQVFIEADKALYQSKESGRNKVTRSDQL
jgi:diguanylate cyclase (GGDEF)-like protein